MANNTNNIMASSDEAVLNFASAIIEQAGNLMLDEEGSMYYIDGIEFYGEEAERQLVVLSSGRRYVIIRQGDGFLVKLPALAMKSGNDSVFGDLVDFG